MNFHIVDTLSEESWRSFVDNHQMGNIFHTPEMFHVFQRAKLHSPKILASIDVDGQIQALMPLVYVTLRDGLLRAVTSRAIAYGGVLAADGPVGNDATTFLLKKYIDHSAGNFLFTELRHLSDASSLRQVFKQLGFTYEDHLDYMIDINHSPEQVLQNIGSRTRKHIRTGLRKGNIVVDALTQKEQISDWYQLIQNTYRTARVPLADQSLFDAAFDELFPCGMIKFWLAKIGEVNVAASAELLYKNVMYGWYGGVDRAYIREVPGELIMWHILKWGAENGYSIYDFGGAGKPNEESGVRDFKSKFGGDLVCYGRDTFVPNRLLFNISALVYKLYQKFL